MDHYNLRLFQRLFGADDARNFTVGWLLEFTDDLVAVGEQIDNTRFRLCFDWHHVEVYQ